jgi:hypothetical protein
MTPEETPRLRALPERGIAERVIVRIDFFRNLGGLLLLGGIGVAALVAGGTAGLVVGVALLAAALGLAVAWARRPT